MQFIFVHSHYILFNSKLSREGTVSVYYMEMENNSLDGYLHWTMEQKSPEVLEFLKWSNLWLLDIWVFSELKLCHIIIGRPTRGHKENLFSDSNFKSEERKKNKNSEKPCLKQKKIESKSSVFWVLTSNICPKNFSS